MSAGETVESREILSNLRLSVFVATVGSSPCRRPGMESAVGLLLLSFYLSLTVRYFLDFSDEAFVIFLGNMRLKLCIVKHLLEARCMMALVQYPNLPLWQDVQIMLFCKSYTKLST